MSTKNNSNTPKEIGKIIKEGGYDFLDFGCSKGASLRYGIEKLGGKRGLGLDIDPRKVEQTVNNGFDAIVADVTELAQASDIVRFVILSHFLEHMEGFAAARWSIECAVIASNDFVFVQQPWFDSDGYLASKGLKLYWSDWSGHPYHMTTLEFHNIISRMPKVKGWGMYSRKPISKSSNNAIHPLSSPINQHEYNESEHPPKPTVRFGEPVFHEVVLIIQTGDFNIKRIKPKIRVDNIIYEAIPL